MFTSLKLKVGGGRLAIIDLNVVVGLSCTGLCPRFDEVEGLVEDDQLLVEWLLDTPGPVASGAAALGHRLDYIKEGMEHLFDRRTYLPLDNSYPMAINIHIRKTLTMYRRGGMLSKRMTERCNPPGYSKTARLYF